MARPTSAPRPNLIIASCAIATISSVFPGLAAGALAVQASDDFGVTEGRYGWALGSFFLAAAFTSVAGGRLVQRIGPRRQLAAGLVATAIVQVLIAGAVPSFAWMLVALMAAGVINSGVQTAVNLALSQADLPRLGLAMATKQSAMPAAAMLGGLAVPAVALTLGWRWAYAMGAGVALIGLTLVLMHIDSGPSGQAPKRAGVVESSRKSLGGAAVVCMLLAFTSGAINAWTVSSGVDAGLSEGTAGLLLSAAAGFGIVGRLLAGSRVDASSTPPFRMAAQLYVIGIVGFVLLSLRVPPVHAVATMLAFGGGWIWPVFTNFAIVSANPQSAGAATGITQMGVYTGVFLAPILTGQLIDSVGYTTMWLVIAAVGVVAAVGATMISPSFEDPSRIESLEASP